MLPMHEDKLRQLTRPYPDEPFSMPSAGWRKWAYDMAQGVHSSETEKLLANCLLIALRALHEVEREK